LLYSHLHAAISIFKKNKEKISPECKPFLVFEKVGLLYNRVPEQKPEPHKSDAAPQHCSKPVGF
jgi:hypothetical protein